MNTIDSAEESQSNSGIVQRVEGEYAWVAIGRSASCGNCDSRDGCSSGLLGVTSKSREYRLLNTIKAKVGDTVLVSLPEGMVFRATVLAYLLPLILGIAGASLGMWLLGDDVAALLGLMFGLGVGWFLLHRLSLPSREPLPRMTLQSKVVHLQPRLYEEI